MLWTLLPMMLLGGNMGNVHLVVAREDELQAHERDFI